MYIIQNPEYNASCNSLNEALSLAQAQNERTSILEAFTNKVLYEWSPEFGLKQFLVD